MAKRILVPLDRSPEAEPVIPIVADTARAGHAVVRLLHVAPEPEVQMDARGRVVAYADQEMVRLGNEALDYLRTVELYFDGVQVETIVRFGDPVSEILHEAEAFGADLIAVTATGRSGIGRAVLGSVAEHVYRKAKVPVMLIRPGAGPSSEPWTRLRLTNP